MDEKYINADLYTVVEMTNGDSVYLEFTKTKPNIPLDYSDGQTVENVPAAISGIFISKAMAKALAGSLLKIKGI